MAATSSENLGRGARSSDDDRSSSIRSGKNGPQAHATGAPATTSPGAPGLDLATLYGIPFKEAKQALLDDFETRYFTHLLEAHDGNLSRASAEAGITRYYLRELLKRLGLHRVKDDDA